MVFQDFDIKVMDTQLYSIFYLKGLRHVTKKTLEDLELTKYFYNNLGLPISLDVQFL